MRLKELRTSKNLFQKEVAEILGIDRTTYSKYENGASEPSHEILLKLAEIFEVSTDYLLGRDKKEPTSVSADGLDPELVELIKRIPDDRMPEVERYLRFQAEKKENL